jgi:cell wall-associated NlpC family hydrolase
VNDQGQAQNTSSGGFFEKLGNLLSGNGWKTDAELKPQHQNVSGGRRDATAAESAQFLDEANGYLGTTYQRGGNTHAGIDCSGLVCAAAKDAGLAFNKRYSADALQKSPYLRALGSGESPRSGDVAGFSGHIGVYDANPPVAGSNILSARSGAGEVAYAPASYFGAVTYYRVRVTCGDSGQ